MDEHFLSSDFVGQVESAVFPTLLSEKEVEEEKEEESAGNGREENEGEGEI